MEAWKIRSHSDRSRLLASKVGLNDFDGNETWLIALFPQTASFVDAKKMLSILLECFLIMLPWINLQ